MSNKTADARLRRRIRMFEAQDRKCGYCFRLMRLHADAPGYRPIATWTQKIPPCRGGTGALSNLLLACFRCNRDKGDRTETEYRHLLDWRDRQTPWRAEQREERRCRRV